MQGVDHIPSELQAKIESLTPTPTPDPSSVILSKVDDVDGTIQKVTGFSPSPQGFSGVSQPLSEVVLAEDYYVGPSLCAPPQGCMHAIWVLALMVSWYPAQESSRATRLPHRPNQGRAAGPSQLLKVCHRHALPCPESTSAVQVLQRFFGNSKTTTGAAAAVAGAAGG